MGFATTQDRAEFQRQYVAYQEAWRRFSLNVSHWQSLESAAPSDGVAVRQALNAVRQAEDSYREIRNRLAEFILTHSSSAEQLVNC